MTEGKTMSENEVADVSRRDLAAFFGVLTGAAGLAALASCSAEAGGADPAPPGEATRAVAQALTGGNFLWFDTIVGASQSLRSVSGSDSGSSSTPVAVVGGYAAQNDGGGGVFYWSTTSGVDDGGTVIVPVSGGDAGPGASGACWKRIYSGALNAKWFGATGNGSTDDTGALRAAIAAAASLPVPASVYVASGTYKLSSTVALANPMTLSGDGTASVLLFNVSDVGLEVASSNVTVQNLTITGATASRVVAIAGPQGPADGGAAPPISDVTVRGCVVSGGTLDAVLGEPSGIWLFNVTNVWIEDNTLSGNGDGNTTYAHGADIFFTSSMGPVPCVGVHVTGNSCTSTAAPFGIALFNVVQSVVSGNYVANMCLTDSDVGGYGILVSSSTSDTYLSDRISIVDNEISNTAGSGIYLKLTGSASIVGNTCYNTCISQSDVSLNVGGIAIDDGMVTITGNVIRTSGKAGISFGQGSLPSWSTGFAVSSNVCVGCYNGIQIRGARGFSIHGNTINTCTYGGIVGGIVDSGVIADNYITGCGQYGIIMQTDSVTTMVRTAITGNVVTSAGYSGITLYGTLPTSPLNFDNTVTGNVVMDCGTHASGITASFGIDARGLARSVISNNRVGNSTSTYQDYGIGEGGISGYPQLGNSVTNNSVAGNVTTALYVGSATFHKENWQTAVLTTPTTSQMNGVVNLTGTTPVSISNPEAQLGDSILVSRVSVSGTLGHISATVVSGTPNAIQIVSTGSETSAVYWEIVH